MIPDRSGNLNTIHDRSRYGSFDKNLSNYTRFLSMEYNYDCRLVSHEADKSVKWQDHYDKTNLAGNEVLQVELMISDFHSNFSPLL